MTVKTGGNYADPIPYPGDEPEVVLPAGTLVRFRSEIMLDARDVYGEDAWIEVIAAPDPVRSDPARVH